MTRGRQLFSCDLRSLALFRLALGTALLGDLIDRARFLEAHYSDAGILPRALLLGDLGIARISLHLASGTVAVQAVLFVAAGTAACALLLGYRTRLATVASWALLASLHSRNPLVLQGGDNLLLLLLFWGIFLPLGGRFSVDASGRETTLPNSYFSIATVAVLLQSMTVYLFSALTKTGATWIPDGTAIYHTLQLAEYVTPAGIWIRDYTGMLRGLTYGVWWLELLAPMLMFSPLFHMPLRLATLGALVLLHVGFFLFIKVGIFPFISIISLLPFIPATVWNRLRQYWCLPNPEQCFYRSIDRQRARLGYFAAAQRTDPHHSADLPRLWRPILALLVVLVFYHNLTKPSYIPLQLPHPLSFITDALQLRQHWKMFAPDPPLHDRWYLARGERVDGAVVNALHPDEPTAGWEERGNVSGFIASHRWRWYRSRLLQPAPAQPKVRRYGAYLCEQWNRRYGGEKKLFQIRILLMDRQVRADGQATRPERFALLDEECGILNARSH